MKQEKRKEDRSVITRQPKGKLQILDGSRCIYVFAVIDMSQMGIRLLTNAPLDTGKNVLIRYQADGVDLKLNGTVVWGADSPGDSKNSEESGRYTVGIKVASPTFLQAFW